MFVFDDFLGKSAMLIFLIVGNPLSRFLGVCICVCVCVCVC